MEHTTETIVRHIVSNGVNYTYYRTGEKRKEYYKINNKREGPFKKFNKDGDLIYICNYTNNRKNGLELSYYEDNHTILESKINYVNGKKNGVCILYDEYGTIENQYVFLNDKMQN